MLAIFHDMIEESIEVFMDDFSVFGNSFDKCLNNLDKMLQCCKDAHLVLNWEKCHFMVKEGIVLGHKVSGVGLEVEKVKIDVISKLPPPTNIKGVRSFLGHAGFYRRFIKDFSKIARPLTKLLEKVTLFEFNDECQKAFELLKDKLTCAPVIFLYLMASRPDIMFSVRLYARFQEAPKTSHLEAVKRIFRYIKGTTHLGLWYPKGTDMKTVVYADSDHAGDYMDRKSTSGICTFVGCCLTSWFSKKQTTHAIYTTKAKYVNVAKACQQALWMKQALIDYDIRLDDIPIMFDNKGAIDLSKNPVQHSRTKHIKIRHHFLRDNVQK
ncbi:hypothetical protein Tco_0701177 [Tanacetum coccineum]